MHSMNLSGVALVWLVIQIGNWTGGGGAGNCVHRVLKT